MNKLLNAQFIIGRISGKCYIHHNKQTSSSVNWFIVFEDDSCRRKNTLALRVEKKQEKVLEDEGKSQIRPKTA